MSARTLFSSARSRWFSGGLLSFGAATRVLTPISTFIHRALAAPVGVQALVIFAVGIMVRLVIALMRGSAHDLVRAEMELEAISLAKDGVLGNAYAVPTGPSALVAPGYAVLLAGIFWLFGTGVPGEAAKIVLSSSISSAQYALLPLLGRNLGLPPSIAAVAGLAGALVPFKPYVEIQGDFEQHLSAALLVVALLWTASMWGSRLRWGRALAYGAFWGAITLVSPSLLTTGVVLLVVIAAFGQASNTARRVTWVAASLLAATIVVLPWTIRNYFALGAPVFTRSNFGLEFHLSNNPDAEPLQNDNMLIGGGILYECCHPKSNVEQARLLQKLGEVAYNDARFRAAAGWIREEPREFAVLTANRFWYTWFPVAPEQWREWLLRFWTPLALVGLYWMWRRWRSAALILGIPLLIYPLPYYFIHVHLRYRYPIDFLLLTCAAAALVIAWRTIRRMRSVPANGKRRGGHVGPRSAVA